MSYCSSCGEKNDSFANFCSKCGQGISQTSPVVEVHGKTCPYCQSPIKSGTPTEVCPICESPHHRECWEENGGCTTFGCTPNQTNHNTVAATSDTWNTNYNQYGSYSAPTTASSNLQEDWALFVRKNCDFYIGKWTLMERNGSSVSWNWPAFFFGFVWLFYRKMYLYGFLLIIAQLLLSSFVVPGFIMWFGMGMFGNYLYKYHTTKKISDLSIVTSDPQARRMMIANAGGTSSAAIWIGLLVLIVLFVFGFIVAILEELMYYY